MKKGEILSLFDDNGKRIASVIEGTNYKTEEKRDEYIKEGYIVTSKKEWGYYIGMFGRGKNGTGYIRDPKTGKPVDAPAYVPTKKEKAEQLYNECQADLKQIDTQIVNAVALGDEKLIADLRQERADRIKQYQEDLAELEGGE